MRQTMFVIGLAVIATAGYWGLTPTMTYAAPACTTGTFNDYVALGSGGCTIGDKLFNNFTLTTVEEVPLGLTVIPDPMPLNPGIDVTWTPLTCPAIGSDCDVFENGTGFDVTVLSGGAPINDIGFVVNGSGTGFGGNVATTPSSGFGGLTTLNGVPAEHKFAPVSAASVLFGSGPPGCIECAVVFDVGTTVTGMAFHFSETVPVPEPGMSALVATGLLGFSLLWRLRQN
jgi:hypothetical protein